MKCIIVDDEPLARTGVSLLLQSYHDIQVVGSFNQAAEALAFIMLNSVDLIFLDIRMQGINGIDFARSINKNIMIIFVTAHADYALDSYEVDAIDYLVKPINNERFHKSVRKALDYISLLKQANLETSVEFSPDYIVVRAGRQYVKVELNEILYIEGLKDYVIIYLSNSTNIVTNQNLKMIYNEIQSSLFFRISKSYIVNFSHIKTFDNNFVTIEDREIPIGNVYREEFFNKVIRKK